MENLNRIHQTLASPQRGCANLEHPFLWSFLEDQPCVNAAEPGNLPGEGAHFPSEEALPVLGSAMVLQPRYRLVRYKAPGFKLH